MTPFEGRWKPLRATKRTGRLPDTFAVSCGRPDQVPGGWCRGQVCIAVPWDNEWRAMHRSGLYKDGDRYRAVHGHRRGQRTRPEGMRGFWGPDQNGAARFYPDTRVVGRYAVLPATIVCERCGRDNWVYPDQRLRSVDAAV